METKENNMSKTEGAIISNPKDMFNYIRGGRCRFTVVSQKSGTRMTFKVKKAKTDPTKTWQKAAWFVWSLGGILDSSTLTYLGMIDEGGNFKATAKTRPETITGVHYKTFDWLVRHLNVPTPKLEQVEFWHSGRCAMCGRKLTVPSSVSFGFGPECSTKAVNY